MFFSGFTYLSPNDVLILFSAVIEVSSMGVKLINFFSLDGSLPFTLTIRGGDSLSEGGYYGFPPDFSLWKSSEPIKIMSR
jgi:hypothetical protein